MSGLNHHRQPYDEGTTQKLELYRGYLREWLPVFFKLAHVSTVNVFDFFAGPGTDMEGNAGSPLIAIDEIKNVFQSSCAGSAKKVNLYLNEFGKTKNAELADTISVNSTPWVVPHIEKLDFNDAFAKWLPEMKKRGTANLLFLDQNGVSFITANVFRQIIAIERTDFLFFISSSVANRFKREESIIGKIPVSDTDLAIMNGSNAHRIITEAYRRLIPQNKTYYLAPYSIKKSANVYGLIFGSGHPLGMNKFLQNCWDADRDRGEANFSIDGEKITKGQLDLFSGNEERPTKITAFENELCGKVLDGKLNDNCSVYIYALERGFLGSHAKKALESLVASGKLPKQQFHISYDAWSNAKHEPIKRKEADL